MARASRGSHQRPQGQPIAERPACSMILGTQGHVPSTRHLLYRRSVMNGNRWPAWMKPTGVRAHIRPHHTAHASVGVNHPIATAYSSRRALTAHPAAALQ